MCNCVCASLTLCCGSKKYKVIKVVISMMLNACIVGLMLKILTS
jgi:hypothetical protein